MQATPQDKPYLQDNFDPVEPVKFSPPGDRNVGATMTTP